MSDLIYPISKKGSLGASANGGPIDWDADPIYCMLVNSTYVGTSLATLKTHDFINDVQANEIIGTGYTAGGVQLSGAAIVTSGDSQAIDFTDPSWASATITARGAVIYKRVGADLSTPADDPVLLLLDFGADKTSTGGTFTVVLNSGGLYQLT